MGLFDISYSIPQLSFCAVLPFALIFVAWVTLNRDGGGPEVFKAPILGASSSSKLSAFKAKLKWTSNGVSMIHRAYEQAPDRILRAPTNEDFLILPPKYIDELKLLPDTKLNATHAIVDVSKIAPKLMYHWDSLIFLLANSADHLALGLPNFIDSLVNQCASSLARELPCTQEWTVVAPQPRMLQVVARMNARIFVGQSLQSNKLWLDTSINFSRSVFMSGGFLKLFPEFIRPVIALMLPDIYRIRAHHRNARQVLLPEIRRRREREGRNQDTQGPPMDMMEILERVSAEDEKSPEQLVNRQLGLAFAATHGTTNLVVNVIYDLAARWDEYGLELRNEVEAALAETGGRITKITLNKLSKLDSFMKECQRLEPGSALSFFRKVMAPLKLSTGETIPMSTQIAVAAGPMTKSPEYYSSPDIFDGFRFHRLRHESDDVAAKKANLFTTASLGCLMFGYGKFACPGRFYAETQSKIILAHLLLHYDFKVLDGKERPKSVVFADANVPDPTTEILFRMRQG